MLLMKCKLSLIKASNTYGNNQIKCLGDIFALEDKSFYDYDNLDGTKSGRLINILTDYVF